MNKFWHLILVVFVVATFAHTNITATTIQSIKKGIVKIASKEIGLSVLFAQELGVSQSDHGEKSSGKSEDEIGGKDETDGKDQEVFDKLNMIEANFAYLQTLDKITGRISELKVRVGKEVVFERILIRNNICLKNPKQEQPSSKVHLTIIEEGLDKNKKNIFSGWMFSSLPALNPVQHPVYDVWLKECLLN